MPSISQAPIQYPRLVVVRHARFERATFGSGGRGQLSDILGKYGTFRGLVSRLCPEVHSNRKRMHTSATGCADYLANRWAGKVHKAMAY